jgi:orotidine-5'-phosphate decarboxylase
MAELIVALDLPEPADAVALLDRLPDRCAVKVGSILMTAAGPGFIRALVDAGHPVFLDLKWHDIPNTVRGAVEAARALGVEMATVHALGGEAMVRAAVAGAGATLKIVAVTVLTSHDAAGFGEVVGRRIGEMVGEVGRLAEVALRGGAHGVVCSPAEVALVAAIAGGRRVVVPGIRRPGDLAGDQVRTASPGEAVAAGATHLVVGRPILDAEDPSAAYREIAELMGGG